MGHPGDNGADTRIFFTDNHLMPVEIHDAAENLFRLRNHLDRCLKPGFDPADLGPAGNLVSKIDDAGR